MAKGDIVFSKFHILMDYEDLADIIIDASVRSLTDRQKVRIRQQITKEHATNPVALINLLKANDLIPSSFTNSAYSSVSASDNFKSCREILLAMAGLPPSGIGGDSGGWLLNGGIWDDSGIWDDAAIWQD
jgi:hypothetical protein